MRSTNTLKNEQDSHHSEMLLGRTPVLSADPAVTGYYRGKRVLVTGGGGSIGSELCRQIAHCSPAALIILDIYENNAYEIQQELTRKYGKTFPLFVEIASVRDRARLDAIFASHHPEIVFHAAAHKHVPLMEENPSEAVKNNVFGSQNVFDIAEKYGVDKCILISTDKAVNPSSVMGASKRMCEMLAGSRADSTTIFASVRFGNVLDSNGSVIPLFRRQIAEGGPVTLTDRRMTRYFMTITEASLLVMQAGAIARGSELFTLDMGKPIHIYDLACELIRACGLVPEKDIEITEIGLRPGEKLNEELSTSKETLIPTAHARIFVEQSSPLPRADVEARLTALAIAIAKEENKDIIRQALQIAVPTYHPKA